MRAARLNGGGGLKMEFPVYSIVLNRMVLFYTLKDDCMCEIYIAGGGALADDKVRAPIGMLFDVEALRFRDSVEHRLHHSRPRMCPIELDT